MLLDLKELVNKYNLNIRGVVQVGAHFGQETQLYSDLGIANMLFFEPHPDTFEILKQNVGGKATLIQSALANYKGVADFFCEQANTGMSNSLLEPGIHLSQYPHIQFNNKIQVPVSRLDEFIAFAPIYNFLNLDTQGTELEVLKGGSEFLHYVDYIMTEVNFDEVYKGCAQIGELEEFLSKYGFERKEIDYSPLSWGDAFYIKRK